MIKALAIIPLQFEGAYCTARRMSQLPFQIIGFDLDGTLLETHRDLGAAVNHALELGGFEKVPADHASDLIGGGAKIMLQRAVDE